MSDDFKRAQIKSNSPHCGPDCCGSGAKKHGQARAKLKRDDLAEWEQLVGRAFNSPEYKEAAAKVPASFTF